MLESVIRCFRSACAHFCMLLLWKYFFSLCVCSVSTLVWTIATFSVQTPNKTSTLKTTIAIYTPLAAWGLRNLGNWSTFAALCFDLAIWKLQNHGRTLLSCSKCCSTSLALHSAIIGYILGDKKMLFGNTLLPAPTRLHSGVTYSAAVLRSSLSPPRCSASTTAC